MYHLFVLLLLFCIFHHSFNDTYRIVEDPELVETRRKGLL